MPFIDGGPPWIIVTRSTFRCISLRTSRVKQGSSSRAQARDESSRKVSSLKRPLENSRAEDGLKQR